MIRLTYALVDAWMDSYPREPEAVTLDIDDTCDVVHGHQQLSLFNAHYDERCFLPIHVYDTERSRPVAVVLRPGKTPSGVEVRAHIRRLVRLHHPPGRDRWQERGRRECVVTHGNVVPFRFRSPGRYGVGTFVEGLKPPRGRSTLAVSRYFAVFGFGPSSDRRRQKTPCAGSSKYLCFLARPLILSARFAGHQLGSASLAFSFVTGLISAMI